MRRFFMTLIFVALTTATVSAQQEGRFRYATDPFAEAPSAPSESKPTEEAKPTESASSFSSFESQGTESISLVQKRAMFKAEQRQLILASRQWYGYSQSRPVVFADPYMNHYYPIAAISHTWQQPYRSWQQRTWQNTFTWR